MSELGSYVLTQTRTRNAQEERLRSSHKTYNLITTALQQENSSMASLKMTNRLLLVIAVLLVVIAGREVVSSIIPAANAQSVKSTVLVYGCSDCENAYNPGLKPIRVDGAGRVIIAR
jgi:hypothetical protein